MNKMNKMLIAEYRAEIELVKSEKWDTFSENAYIRLLESFIHDIEECKKTTPFC